MKDGVNCSLNFLSDEVCEALCKAAKEKSASMGVKICFAICDPDGHPRLFRRFGDAQLLSVEMAPAKAYTAAITGTPSGEFANLIGEGKPLMGLSNLDKRILPVAGGFPLKIAEKCVAGIGVGGGMGDQDSQIATFVVEQFDALMKK